MVKQFAAAPEVIEQEGMGPRQGVTLITTMPNDDKNTKPKKTLTLWDLFQSKHGPAAFQRMAGRPGLTLGEALKEIREERREAEDGLGAP